MALDIAIPNEVEVTQPVTVATTKTRIKGTFFDFDNTRAVASIAFGDDVNGEFVAKREETWVLSGNHYLSIIGSALLNKPTIGEELLTQVANVVTQIQTDATFKQELLDNGELKIYPTDIMKMISGI